MPILTNESIRAFISDKPEYNTLLDGVRFSDEQIQEAMLDTVDYFNCSSPPIGSGYNLDNFPFRYPLKLGTCGILLKGAAVHQASNQFDYNAAGVSIQDENKAGIFQQLGATMWEEYKDMVKQIKVAQNISSFYGDRPSEYAIRRDI